MKIFSKEKLEEVAENSLYTTFTNSATILYSAKILERFISEGKILELGPAEGLMTPVLLKYDPGLTVIEGSSVFSEKLRQKFPSLTVLNCLFEVADIPENSFDFIILGHVLEHVENPGVILARAKKWIKPGGKIFCAVPNANSLHRQAAVEMGLIKSVFEMSDKDKHHGHMRIYNPETFKAEFNSVNLDIDMFGGYWLKPVSDKQIESSWTGEMLQAFLKMGESYPAIAAEIYIVASKKK